jgi:hypothetical protein
MKQSNKLLPQSDSLLITVVIPLFKANKWVSNIVNNLKFIDHHTMVIISNDGVEDEAFLFLKEQYKDNPRIIFRFNPKRLGWRAHCNLLIELCNTPYFAILPQDDSITEFFYEKLYTALENDPTAGLAFGAIKIDNSKDENTYITPPNIPLGTLAPHTEAIILEEEWGLAFAFRALIKKSALKTIPSTTRDIHADKVWIFSMLLTHHLLFVEDAVCIKRYHQTNTHTQWGTIPKIETKQHLLQQIKLSTLSEENKTPLIEFIQKRIDEITVAYQIPNSKIKEICLVSFFPDDDSQHEVHQLLNALLVTLQDLNISASYKEKEFDQNKINIIFGWHHVCQNNTSLSPQLGPLIQCVFFNLEPLIDHNQPWLTQYLSDLCRFPVIDYSYLNYDILTKLENQNVFVFKFGYIPLINYPLTKKQEHFLIYNSTSEQQKISIQKIQNISIPLSYQSALPKSDYLLTLINSLGIVHLNQYENDIMPVVKVWNSLCSQLFTLVECNQDIILEKNWSNYVYFLNLNNISRLQSEEFIIPNPTIFQKSTSFLSDTIELIHWLNPILKNKSKTPA